MKTMALKGVLIVVSCSIAALAVLCITRLMAPQLLGVPLDMQAVQVSTKVTPFFDVVLNEQEITGEQVFIKDPFFKHRRQPLKIQNAHTFNGPVDILGFRNTSVPNRPKVVVIGDSQTLGHAVPYIHMYSNKLAARIPQGKPFYNMSVSGWGPIEYFEIAKKALLFHPKVLIVAFYSGNDSIDALVRAYSKDRWKFLRPENAQDNVERPRARFPAPENEKWRVVFDDGVQTVMTPHLRYACNSDHPGVRAGYAVLVNVAEQIARMCADAQVKTVFTMIPTKEPAFAKRVENNGIDPDPKYAELIKSEMAWIRHVRERMAAIPGAVYTDVVTPLQDGIATSPQAYYARTGDGHPKILGHQAIADTLEPAIARLIAEKK